jgi:hypothetical protein
MKPSLRPRITADAASLARCASEFVDSRQHADFSSHASAAAAGHAHTDRHERTRLALAKRACCSTSRPTTYRRQRRLAGSSQKLTYITIPERALSHPADRAPAHSRVTATEDNTRWSSNELPIPRQRSSNAVNIPTRRRWNAKCQHQRRDRATRKRPQVHARPNQLDDGGRRPQHPHHDEPLARRDGDTRRSTPNFGPRHEVDSRASIISAIAGVLSVRNIPV